MTSTTEPRGTLKLMNDRELLLDIAQSLRELIALQMPIKIINIPFNGQVTC